MTLSHGVSGVSYCLRQSLRLSPLWHWQLEEYPVRYLVEHPSFGIHLMSFSWWGLNLGGEKAERENVLLIAINQPLSDFVSFEWGGGWAIVSHIFVLEFNSSKTFEPYRLVPPVSTLSGHNLRESSSSESFVLSLDPVCGSMPVSQIWLISSYLRVLSLLVMEAHSCPSAPKLKLRLSPLLKPLCSL